jgi:hypothetical protein
MNTPKIVTLAATAVVALSSAAFAQRTSGYPEGSVFMAPSTAQSSTTARTTPASEEAQLSPYNPLNAPDAGNVWKPSNRDAGNLSVRRWEEYAARRAAAQPRAQ